MSTTDDLGPFVFPAEGNSQAGAPAGKKYDLKIRVLIAFVIAIVLFMAYSYYQSGQGAAAASAASSFTDNGLRSRLLQGK